MLAEIEQGSKIVETFDELGRVVMGKTAIRRAKKTLLGPLIQRFARKQAS